MGWGVGLGVGLVLVVSVEVRGGQDCILDVSFLKWIDRVEQEEIMRTYLQLRFLPPTLLMARLCCRVRAIASLRPDLQTEHFLTDTLSINFGLRFRLWCARYNFRFRFRRPRYHSFIWAISKLRRRTTTLLVAAFLRIILAMARSRPDLEAIDFGALTRLWLDR